jgi:tetratricopeptide (TPR) repeat protein
MKLLRFFVFFLLAALPVFAAADVAVQSDIPAEAAAQFAEAEAHRSQGKFNLSYPIYSELRKKYPNSFSAAYARSSLLAQMKLYRLSAEALQEALHIGLSKPQLPDPSIYNTMGWVAIMNGEFDQALEYFNKAKQPELYRRLSGATKMKLHNNTGYALMLLDRYEESLLEFAQAEKLGSDKAAENIEKVKSLIETQKKQDPNIPGVFAVVLLSTRHKERIDASVLSMSGRLSTVPEQDRKINVYLAKNGMYFIVLGGNCSYAKAQAMLAQVRKTVADAFVSSTTSWEPYTIDGGQQLQEMKP